MINSKPLGLVMWGFCLVTLILHIVNISMLWLSGVMGELADANIKAILSIIGNMSEALAIVSMIVAVTLSICWVRRLLQNLEYMQVVGLMSKHVTWLFLVPVMGLIPMPIIYQVIWKASDPQRLAAEEWKGGPGSLAIWAWFLLGFIVPLMCQLLASNVGADPRIAACIAFGDLNPNCLFGIDPRVAACVAIGSEIASMLIALRLILKIADRQFEKRRLLLTT